MEQITPTQAELLDIEQMLPIGSGGSTQSTAQKVTFDLHPSLQSPSGLLSSNSGYLSLTRPGTSGSPAFHFFSSMALSRRTAHDGQVTEVWTNTQWPMPNLESVGSETRVYSVVATIVTSDPSKTSSSSTSHQEGGSPMEFCEQSLPQTEKTTSKQPSLDELTLGCSQTMLDLSMNATSGTGQGRRRPMSPPPNEDPFTTETDDFNIV